MTAREINWLRDAYNLIFYYKISAVIRNRVNTTLSYNNRSVFFYIETLIRFSSNYFGYYRKIFQHDIAFFSNSKNRQTWKDTLPNRLWTFFDKCDKDTGEMSKVRQAISGSTSRPSLYSEEELRQLIEADNTTNAQRKADLIDKFLEKKSRTSKEISTTEQPESPYDYFIRQLEEKPAYQTPKEQLAILKQTPETKKDIAQPQEGEESPYDYLAKNLPEETRREDEEEQAQAPQMPDERLIRDLMRGEERVLEPAPEKPLPPEPKPPSERPPTPRTPSLARAADTRLLGGAVKAGGGLLRTGGSLAARGGAAAAAGAVGTAGAMGGGIAAMGPVIAVVFVALILGMVLLMAFNNINQTNSLFPPYQVAEAAPLSPYSGGEGEDISQCKFFRTKEDLQGASFKSKLLLSYFQEASNLTKIPTEVLAAFTRVESPNSVNLSDEEIQALGTPAKCPRSPTGALGIMQIQPKGTTGHAAEAVTNGAKLVGLNYESLTELDYCDSRKSVIMGAGFLLKKMSYRNPSINFPGLGDGTIWDPAWTNDKKAIEGLVSGYYGCLIYGGPNPLKCEGPQNYAEDVWRSIQSCEPIPVTTTASSTYTPGGGSGLISCPVNSGTITTGSKEITSGHCSPSYEKRFPCVKPGQSGYTGRDTAVDLKGSDRKVFLPLIGGQGVSWTIDESGTKIQDHEGGGIAVAATHTSTEGKKYRIRFVHLLSTKLNVGQQPPSATEVGEYNFNANHIHVTLQEDGVYKPADLYFNLCK